MSQASTEDQRVEQPASGLFEDLGWGTASPESLPQLGPLPVPRHPLGMLLESDRLLFTLRDSLSGLSALTEFQKLLFLYTRKELEPLHPGQNKHSLSNA